MRIMMVCTGNICRSPYAQLRLQDMLDAVHPGQFTVTSAGTHALVGAPVDPHTRSLLEAHGIDSERFAARALDPREVARTDLVLTMTVQQRHEVLEASPAALKRTFTVLELGVLLDRLADRLAHDPQAVSGIPVGGHDEAVAARWKELTRLMGGMRSRTEGSVLDVEDPYRRPREAFQRMEDVVAPVLAQMVECERAWR